MNKSGKRSRWHPLDEAEWALEHRKCVTAFRFLLKAAAHQGRGGKAWRLRRAADRFHQECL